MLECQETVKEEELFNKYVGNTKKMLRLKNVCKSDDICMRNEFKCYLYFKKY